MLSIALGLWLVPALAAALPQQSAPAGPATRGSAEGNRLVVLGFDGADCRIVQKLLDDGQLPNLQKLRDTGSFYPLRTTNPAQSPVSWAAFNTGMGPDTTNIYDFVCRLNVNRDTGEPLPAPVAGLSLTYPVNEDADRILPRFLRSGMRIPLILGSGLLLFGVFFALFHFGARFPVRATLVLSLVLGAATSVFAASVARYIPSKVPVPRSERRGTPFWNLLDAARVPTVGLAVPMVFPLPEEPLAHTKILAGLGVPDARQSWGDCFLLSTDAARLDALAEIGDMGNKTVLLDRDTENDRGATKAYKAVIEGPKNFWIENRLRAEIDEITQRYASGKTSPDENRALGRRKDELQRELFARDASAIRTDLREVERKLANPKTTAEEKARLAKRRGELEQDLANPTKTRATIQLTARPSEDKKKVSIELEHKEVTRADGSELMAGDWSPIVRAKFQLNPLLSVSTLVAFRVVSIDPLEIFLKPLNLDPKSPPPTAPISAPKGFSGELASSADVKDFETLGWACATNPLKDELIDEDTFLGDVERVFAQRERILADRLARNDWRLLYMVFGETDRIQHMMFRHYDPQHPGYNAEAAGRIVTFFGKKMPAKETIAEIYRQADRIVGDAWRRVNDGRTQLMVVSDHGFAPFRYGVHVNKWLYDHGYLTVRDTSLIEKEKVPNLFSGKTLGYVDWSTTRAYSLGLGKIYLNLKGREPRGIVEPKDADALEREIAAALEADVDPNTKKPFVKKAYLAREIYPDRGKNMRPGDRDNSEDLVLGFHEGYRISWESTLGGFTDEVTDPEKLLAKGRIIVVNRQKWSGDHCSVDPSLVTGIFFSTTRYQAPSDAPVPDVRHCAPTILDYFGCAVPAGMRAPLQPPRK